MGKYIFAPAGNRSETVGVLKNCIEFIGSYQEGNGSNYAKGKRYIKNKVGCSGASIKFLFKTFPKVINHEFEDLGLFVFRFDKNKCKSILLAIINSIDDTTNEDEKNALFNSITRPVPYLDELFSKQKKRIEWVFNHNYKMQKDSAYYLINELKTIITVLE